MPFLWPILTCEKEDIDQNLIQVMLKFVQNSLMRSRCMANKVIQIIGTLVVSTNFKFRVSHFKWGFVLNVWTEIRDRQSFARKFSRIYSYTATTTKCKFAVSLSLLLMQTVGKLYLWYHGVCILGAPFRSNLRVSCFNFVYITDIPWKVRRNCNLYHCMVMLSDNTISKSNFEAKIILISLNIVY